MHFLHTMVRIGNIEDSLDFYCNKLGLIEVSRKEYEQGRFTLIFLAAPGDYPENQGETANPHTPMLELTYNWDAETLNTGRNFGHLAYAVDNIYASCQRLIDAGLTINRPPRDGYMAFIRSPDGISIELLQVGEPMEPVEPWLSMPNTGHW